MHKLAKKGTKKMEDEKKALLRRYLVSSVNESKIIRVTHIARPEWGAKPTECTLQQRELKNVQYKRLSSAGFRMVFQSIVYIAYQILKDPSCPIDGNSLSSVHVTNTILERVKYQLVQRFVIAFYLVMKSQSGKL